MDQTLRQIKHSLASLTNSVPPSLQHKLQEQQVVCQWLWDGLKFMVCFISIQYICPHQKLQKIRKMAPGQISIHDLCQCCPQPGVLMSVCNEQTTVLVTVYVALYFQDHLGLGLNLMSYSSGTRDIIVTRDDQLELCVPHYFEAYIGSHSHISGWFYYTRFQYHSSNALQIQMFIPVFSP